MPNSVLANTVAVFAAYLIGSLSFAVIVSWAFRLPSPHTYGSGNPGATNVLRTGKKLAAGLTLLGDASKGWLAVWLAQHYANQYQFGAFTIAGVALAVFMGHLYPIFFRFKGGKGVATALGILLALNIWLGLITLATWVVVALVSRYSSLGAIVASAMTPFYAMLLDVIDLKLLAILVMAIMLVWRHKENINKLLNGTESKIGGNKAGSKTTVTRKKRSTLRE